MKAWPRMAMLAVRSRLRPRMGRSLALRRPWSASTRLLAYWVVRCGRQEVRDHADQGVGPVSGDLSRLTVRADRIGEEFCRSSQITLLRHEHVDDLPVLVNGPIDVPPGPGDLHVGLIDKPVTTHDVAARPSRVDEQGREPLTPTEQGHVVNLDTAFSEQLLQIPVGQSVT